MVKLSPLDSEMNQNRRSIKHKKIIIRSVVGGVSALILGLGIGFIAIGINRPYTTINLNKTNLSIPQGYDTDITQLDGWEQSNPLNLMVVFDNHHQPNEKKYPDMDNKYFDEHRSSDSIYWTLQIDKDHRQYLDTLRIDSEKGTLEWIGDAIASDPVDITVWISVELMIHGFDDEIVLKSSPISMTIVTSSGEM